MISILEIEERVAATPGALGSLWWHAVRDLGILPDTPTMRRRSVTLELPVAPTSMNLNAIRSDWKGFHAAKKSWQGDLMRELHRLDLPRPIPALHALWAHLVVTYPQPSRQESENRRPVVAKALGDALTGPRHKDPELDRGLVYPWPSGPRYVGGWLNDDKDADWVLTMAIDPTPGDYRTVVRLTWDEAPV